MPLTKTSPASREVGVEPQTLFDTELGARLAGLPPGGLTGSCRGRFGDGFGQGTLCC